jgi:hypothetical protein
MNVRLERITAAPKRHVWIPLDRLTVFVVSDILEMEWNVQVYIFDI